MIFKEMRYFRMTDYFKFEFEGLYADVQDLHRSIYYCSEPYKTSMARVESLRGKYSGNAYAQNMLDVLVTEAERLKAQKLGWLA
jgi:hypothetical protein